MDVAIEFLKDNSALIVSICAIALTLQQGWATIKHNKISVIPKLTTFSHKYFLQESTSVVQLKVTLSNCGLGPAVIKNYEILVDNIPAIVKEPGEYFQVVQGAVSSTLDIQRCRFTLLRKETVIAHGEEMVIADIYAAFTNSQQLDEFKKFHIKISYESLYGQPSTYDSREHLS